MTVFSVIDWVLGGLILLMIVHGFIKGFVEELFSWAALVLAIWVAFLLYPAGGAYIRRSVMEEVRIVPDLLAFIAIFIIIMISIKLLERILKNVIEGANLGAVNKFFGAVFGFVEGIALTSLILFVLSVQPLFDASAIIEGSIFAEFLLPIISNLLDRGKDTVDITFSALAGGFDV
jgi:membrane protein required for colicin V production